MTALVPAHLGEAFLDTNMTVKWMLSEHQVETIVTAKYMLNRSINHHQSINHHRFGSIAGQ